MRSVRKITCVVLLLVLILSGCSGLFEIKGLNTGTGAFLEDNTMDAVKEDVGPAPGGTLNLFMYRPNTLNPLTTKNQTVRHLSLFIFDQLFFEVGDEEVKNGLAESYSVSQDGLVFDFALRDKIFFHDGEQLSADDVAFTIEAIQKAGEKSIYHRNVSGIESVQALGRLGLKIVLKNPDPVFVNKLTFPIVPRHIFEEWPVEGHNEKLIPIGTGPYIYAAYDDNEITLTRNESYWYLDSDEGISHPLWIDKITFKIYANESDIMAAFQKKEVDIAYLDADTGVYSKRTDIYCNEYESDKFEILAVSPKGLKNSPVSDEAFRKAIIEYLCWYSEKEPVENGKAELNALFSFTRQNALDRRSTINALLEAGYKYDEEENILYSAKNGAKSQIVLQLLYNGVYEERTYFSEWISKALFEIGIKVSAQNVTSLDTQKAVASGSFDMIILGCRMPVSASLSEMPDLISESLAISGNNFVVLPLSRKNGVLLYQKNIKGPRKPIWKNIYNGWSEWYIVE